MKLGCIPNKSLILKFPNEKQLPKNLLKHFIRGYFDGDGYISKNNKPITINILGTKEFLLKLCEIINIDKNKVKNKTLNKNTYYIEINGKNARNFCNFIYRDSNIFLNRKKELYNYYLNKI